MITLWVLLAMAFVAALLITIGVYYGITDEWCDEFPVAMTATGSFVAFATLLVALIVLSSQYSETVYLPTKVKALQATIAEQSEYISAEGSASIGNGLEGIEIKKVVMNAISDRNDALARIEYINRNAWWLFKVR